MPSERGARRIAIIGMGPRGLGALEALAARWPGAGDRLCVDVFEPRADPGAGPNFAPDEAPVCLLNTPLRALDIPPPEVSRVGRFDMQFDAPLDPDSFPTRAEIGGYLTARFADLHALDRMAVTLVPARIEALRPLAGGWELRSDRGWHGPYAAVLLTPGQPSVEPDRQWAQWQGHATRGQGAVAQAYGVFNDKAGFANRGTFVIDKDAIVRFAEMNQPGEARDQSAWEKALASV